MFISAETWLEPGNYASQGKKVPHLGGYGEVPHFSGRQQLLLLGSELSLNQELTATASHKSFSEAAVAPGPAPAQQHAVCLLAILGVLHC